MTVIGQSGTSDDPQVPPAEIIRRQLDLRIVTRGRVVFIGLGGIGSFLVRIVAAFLIGIARVLPPEQEITLLLVDGKDFSDRHVYRLLVPDFTNKAEALAGELLDQCDCPGFNVRYLAEFVTPENIHEVIRDGDCVLMGVDNHATRNLVSRHCASGELDNVVLISAGNDGVDVEQQLRGTYGNVQVYIRTDGEDSTAPLHHFHPEIADPVDQSPAELGCDESGEPQLTVTNSLAASMAASSLLRLMSLGIDGASYDEVCFDVHDAAAQPLWLTQRDPAERHDRKPDRIRPK